ncbi:hypothetical protein C8R42DRAFT_641867 [Lentinula raphanica]|nr:hypothetical protein C8R42DRAFT_641867 [Lentinula raphanica]
MRPPRGTFPVYRGDAESHRPTILRLPGDFEQHEQDENSVKARRSRNLTFRPPTASLRECYLQQTGNNLYGDAGSDADGDTHDDRDANTAHSGPAFGANSYYFHENSAINPRARYLSQVPLLRATDLDRAPYTRSSTPNENLSESKPRNLYKAPLRASSRGPARGSSQGPARGSSLESQVAKGKVSLPSQADVDPTKEKFYPPTMRKLIRRAKNYDPCFTEALDRAAADYVETKSHVEKGYLDEHRGNLVKLLYNDTSSFRRAIKRRIRPVAAAAYGLPLTQVDYLKLESSNSADEVFLVQDKVEKLLKDGGFLKHGKDDLGKTNNLANPVLRKAVLEAYYNDSSAIAREFPEHFSTSIPRVGLAFMMTVLLNCIEEYENGPELTNKDLSAATYSETLHCMLGLIDALTANDVHWNKLESNRASWAQAGCKLAEKQIICHCPGTLPLSAELWQLGFFVLAFLEASVMIQYIFFGGWINPDLGQRTSACLTSSFGHYKIGNAKYDINWRIDPMDKIGSWAVCSISAFLNIPAIDATEFESLNANYEYALVVQAQAIEELKKNAGVAIRATDWWPLRPMASQERQYRDRSFMQSFLDWFCHDYRKNSIAAYSAIQARFELSAVEKWNIQDAHLDFREDFREDEQAVWNKTIFKHKDDSPATMLIARAQSKKGTECKNSGNW